MAEPFPYTDERFADIQMLRYRVPGFGQLTRQQKKYVYYLSQAALSGRDILWDQNCRYNLPIRHMLEAAYRGVITDESKSSEVSAFATYVKCVWFANGIHHHYSTDKFQPQFSETFLRTTLQKIGYPIDEELMRIIFDKDKMAKRVNQNDGDDLLLTSAMNYYAPGITQKEAEDYYQAQKTPDDQQPIMYGMNSRLEKSGEGVLHENVWKADGMYGNSIRHIVHWLKLAEEVAENDGQRRVIETLIDFYQTGDLHTFDHYTIQWVSQTQGDIDFTNGFTEVYGDPLGLKASWEGYVNIVDRIATQDTEKLSRNAQWFEDNSPVDSRFKKRECKGITARAVEAVSLGGDLYPASAIGINLPNSNWVRQQYGSKSVTLSNLTHAYAQAAIGNGFYEEFVHPDEILNVNVDVNTSSLHHSITSPLHHSITSSLHHSITSSLHHFSLLNSRLDDLHTHLHECLGHGSGQLLPGIDPDALGAYGSTIEEARADLFALYYIADQKMVELGLIPDPEAYRIQYYTYMMNGLLTQLVRIQPGCQIEEAHMRNRALIARWLLENTTAMQLVSLTPESHIGGRPAAYPAPAKTYLQITSYPALRQGIATLLAEVQRIKSEGDQKAARQLVEKYGVQVNPKLHAEILQRYESLHLAPYKGFINPRLIPTYDTDGQITDINIDYSESYDQQMLRYSQEYSHEH